MSKQVLITGGAGFIGSHLADELLQENYRVRVLDNLSPQVHGLETERPSYLHPEVELIVGDVRDPGMVQRAIAGVDAVYHLAAAVGIGQSMYAITHYTSVNNLGMAVLMESLAEHPVERLVIASSMTLYGEGLYRTLGGRIIAGKPRNPYQLENHDWELRNSVGDPLLPIPTPETKPPCLSSLYALSKYDQERMGFILGQAYGIPTIALRFFNVYGSRQALSNPYAGVLAIFASRLLNNKPPRIFEDGYQQRDFVHVSDVTRACRLALEMPNVAGEVFNIGSGQHYTIHLIATEMAKMLNREEIQPVVTEQYRKGDIRHCFADITKAQKQLGYAPQMKLEEGLTELAEWLAHQTACDRLEEASVELAARGLTV